MSTAGLSQALFLCTLLAHQLNFTSKTVKCKPNALSQLILVYLHESDQMYTIDHM